MLVVLLQLIEKNSPAKAPSPKTMLRMRAAETSPPSIPVSVSSLQTHRRLHAGHPDLPARQLSFEPAFACAASLLSRGPEPEVAVWDASDGAPSPQSCDKRACGSRGEGRRLPPREGAGRKLRAEPRPATHLPGCPGPGQRYFGSFFESSAAESFVRLDCPRATASTASRTLGKTADSLHFLPSASGGVNPALDEAAGDQATRVPMPDYSNKLEK